MSAHFGAFKEALEVFCIVANISGRIQFAQKWPAAAAHILGDALMHYDREGVEDRDHRAALEQDAEDRRVALLEMIDGIEGKSVQSGVLQVDYVREHIEKMGRDAALLVYNHTIVDRFIPPAVVPEAVAQTSEDSLEPPTGDNHGDFDAESQSAVVDPLDAVKPIDVTPPVSDSLDPAGEKSAPMRFFSSQSLKDDDEAETGETGA